MVIKAQSLEKITRYPQFDINYSMGNLEFPLFRERGIIYPVLVSDDGLLLDGYKRYQAALDLGISELETVVRPCTSLPERYTEYRFITLNNAGSPDVLQRISLYQSITEFSSNESILKNWRNRLNLPFDSKALSELLTMLNYPTDIKRYIHKFNMNYNQIRPYLKHGEHDLEIVFKLARDLSIRPVELSSIHDLLYDIALNETVTISQIMHREPIQTILRDPDLNRNQKLEHLKKLLFSMRYPFISSHKRKFLDAIKQFAFDHRVSIHYDPHFESNEIGLRLRLTNVSDFREILGKLNSKRSMHLMEKLFESL